MVCPQSCVYREDTFLPASLLTDLSFKKLCKLTPNQRCEIAKMINFLYYHTITCIFLNMQCSEVSTCRVKQHNAVLRPILSHKTLSNKMLKYIRPKFPSELSYFRWTWPCEIRKYNIQPFYHAANRA